MPELKYLAACLSAYMEGGLKGRYVGSHGFSLITLATTRAKCTAGLTRGEGGRFDGRGGLSMGFSFGGFTKLEKSGAPSSSKNGPNTRYRKQTLIFVCRYVHHTNQLQIGHKCSKFLQSYF